MRRPVLPLLLLVIALCPWSCLDLDSFMFNQTKLSSYHLSTAVIPESRRTQAAMTSEGKTIYGYFVRSSGAHPGITVLYHHGRRDNLQFYWDRVELLYRMGFNVFVYDYKGFGMSEGEPGEGAIYADARAAQAYVAARPDVDPKGIVQYGFSLGCVAAVELAAAGYFDGCFWGRKVAYPAYVEALVTSGFGGYLNWEFCHPAREHGQPAGIDYVHEQTLLALEYMKNLRSNALGRPRR